ncbi:YwdI family protein [Ornithinibacillus halotolerans]|uniref:YwdI family protein n=1 Tax=Ornithinibacillus halotolerans TaxID=1274357 RepID=A0A916W3P5_9BACI|nr:YwdI family protein [Ornithinibacillus halotolerans]GGA63839.1 hypothetical protein GCM10008025_04600 [Ornithinibacillus halotolerans]
MAVANETILLKMMDELKSARLHHNNQSELIKHVDKIRLLCDLILMEDKPQTSSGQSSEISAEELKAMFGKENVSKSAQQSFKKSIELDEEGNGDSIFDF